MTFGCVGNTIRLRSGAYFDLLHPQPDQFTLADIAGALSKICRFGGQVDRFYSIAEHSYWCAWQAKQDGLSEDIQRACLMHDAAEAFIGDVVKPLKIMLPEYAKIEARIEAVIAGKYGLDFTHKAVKQIDRELLIAERRALFTRDGVKWSGEGDVRSLKVPISGWLHRQSETVFLGRASDLGLEVTK